MIPESLRPLLARLKNPYPEDDDSWEAKSHREIAPIAIKLIEEGIDEGLLVSEFKKDGELNKELLEEFILRAAMEISGPSQEERKAHWEEYINRSFEKIEWEIYEVEGICKDGMAQVCKGAKTTKQMLKVKEELTKLKKIYLSKLKAPKTPDKIDMLINLFREYLPGVEKTFMDKQIRKMLKPFGIEYKPHIVRAREYRSQKEGKWYLRRKGKPQ